MAGLCILLLAFALSAGQVVGQSSFPEDGLLVVGDWGDPPRIRVVDPNAGTIVYDYLVDRTSEDSCLNPNVTCIPIGFSHVSHADNDYLDVAVTVWNGQRGNTNPRMYPVIRRVRPTRPAGLEWTIKELNFQTALDGGDICPYDPNDPCAAWNENSRCRMSFVHAFEVIEDRPQDKKVTVVTTDPNSQRILQLTLDYNAGNTCADVDWILDSRNPDWPPGNFVNGVDFYDAGDEGQYMISTFYTASEVVSGGSPLILWKWDGAGWNQAWRFPDPVYGDEALLNTPHMGEVLVDPLSGERWIWYSHSRGLADEWAAYSDQAYGGSSGVLKPGARLDLPPAYMFEAALNPGNPDTETHFSRDQDFLSDGTMLLTDAGCEDLCTYSPRLFHVAPDFLSGRPSTKPGYYTPDHSQQEVLAIPEEAVLGEYACGFQGMFEAQFVPASALGMQLRSAGQTTRQECPAE